MKNSESDKCLYIGTDNDVLIYFLLYVDDIIIATNDLKKFLKIKKELAEEFKMKDLGKLHSYLGLKIDIRDDGIFLSQPVYLKNLLERFNMQDSKPAKTPMEVSSLNEEHSGECITKIKPYRELIGCLRYVMLNTRPDLSAAVNYYSRFQENATEAHWIGVKRILRYINGTLHYPNDINNVMVGYADSDWAGDKDRKSTSDFLFQIFGATVCWITKK